MAGTLETASTFAWWYLDVTEPYETELNIGMCEFHKCNMIKMIWRIFLDSLTIDPKYFDRGPIVSHKSKMELLLKSIPIWNSEVNEDIVQLQKYCE